MKGLAKEIRGNISFEYNYGLKITIIFERDGPGLSEKILRSA